MLRHHLPILSSSAQSKFFSEVNEFLAVEDESTSSQFPKSDLDPKGDMLLFEAFLNDDHSSNSQTKSSSTSLNSLLEETRTFDNSLPEVTTFSNDPCDAECESDDQSYSDEDVLEKIVSLFDEFAGELTLLKSIPSGIDETDCHPEEEIHFTKRLLYDNSSPHPPEEFVSVNSDAAIKSFSPSPIPIKDSDSLIEQNGFILNSSVEEIDLTFTPDDLMPSSIEEDDDESRDILIHEELLDNYSLPLPENESFHFDIPLSSRPPAKPPDGNIGILNIKMMGDVSNQKVPIPEFMITRVSN
nr:hypothetical protein [Tanacetum cinerariifolium]